MAQTTNIKTDICIIGAGAAGLSVAAAAAQMGAKTVLIEHKKMGGDCLNYGCVPSKSLLAAAKAAKECRKAAQFGIHAKSIEIDFTQVMAHVQKVIDTIAVHDSVERFTKLGAHVIQAHATFRDLHTLIAGDAMIQARRYVIATGSTAMVPPIPGLGKIPYLTNETIFSLKEKPEHLIVIGGGPIGCELSQAFVLLGCQVTLVEGVKLLPRDEPDMVSVLREQLVQDGIVIHEHTKVLNVSEDNETIQVQIEKNGEHQIISGTHVLVATGRKAMLEGLNLEAANIAYTSRGIQVDNRLRTCNKRVYAMGDVAGGYQFTHIASYHAGIIIRNLLFRIPAKVDYRAVPWVTYTTPELAHVGLSAEEALKQHPTHKILTFSFEDNDRAQAEGAMQGSIKVITTAKGKILGATILGATAGELLLPWIIAIQEGRTVRDFTNTIAPYPTLSEISKRAAGEFYAPILFSNRIKKLVKFLSHFG